MIASGGRGDDEKISEARAIYNYLMEIDFPKENIILEETSTITYENLLYSFQIGKERMTKPKFLFVTNDYHVFRTSMFARKIGMKDSGLGCKKVGYYLPSAFIREYIALIFRFKWYYIALFILFTIFYILIQ